LPLPRRAPSSERAAHDAVFDPRKIEATGADEDQRPGRGSGHGPTTLGRNILPLERDGLIAVEKGRRDRRSKTLRLTEAGAARFRAAAKEWDQAQKQFEVAFGAQRTVDLRTLLHAVAATDLGINAASADE
jgi:DNA-binding PadR family transcriptional regulator